MARPPVRENGTHLLGERMACREGCQLGQGERVDAHLDPPFFCGRNVHGGSGSTAPDRGRFLADIGI